MSKGNITVDEWLAELSKAGAIEGEGMTFNEIKDKTGRTTHCLRPLLRTAMVSGEIKPVRVRRTSAWGVVQPVMGYQIVKCVKGKK